MLVIDANVARAACGGEGDGFAVLGDELASVPLMWSEARSSLHLQISKHEIGRDDGQIIRERLEDCPVERVDPSELGREAWQIAETSAGAELTTLSTLPSQRFSDAAW